MKRASGVASGAEFRDRFRRACQHQQIAILEFDVRQLSPCSQPSRRHSSTNYDGRNACAEVAESVIREASQDAAIVAL